ncbi:MAG: S8 family serine peptidase [Bacteroidales bacterium]
MKKRHLLIGALLLSFFSAFSQDYSKYDCGLKQKIHILKKERKTEKLYIFVKGDTKQLKEEIKRLGGEVYAVSSNFLTGIIASDKLEELSNQKFTEKIISSKPMKCYSEKAIENTNTDKVIHGESPLKQPYTGKGVIVGIIDTGIDLQHEDFRDPKDPSKSRILYLWDQTADNGKCPKNFSYGSEWTKEQIEENLDNPNSTIEQFDNRGHGTHVAGIAAGNLGIAPESDIIIVKYDFTSTKSPEAVKYILDKAAELGKPCVINASYGTDNCPHDGSDASAVMIDELIAQRPGQFFVAAAGNEGNKQIHMEKEEDNDNMWSWTFSKTIEMYNYIYLEITFIYGTYESKDAKNLKFAFGLNRTEANEKETIIYPGEDLEMSEYFNISDIEEGTPKTISFDGEEVIIDITVSKLNPTVNEFNVKLTKQAESPSPVFMKFYIKGKGLVHYWLNSGNSFNNPEEMDITVDNSFMKFNNDIVVGAPASGKNILAVGAYINRNSWNSKNGKVNKSEYTPSDYADFTSKGPTIDGRIKPEITAPGQYVMSALSSSIKDVGSEKISQDKKHCIQSGTSMAAPVATGIIALLLEKNPNLTHQQIKDLIYKSAVKDNFTGTLDKPNNKWGYGKLDAFALLSNAKVEIEEIINSEKNNNFNIYPNPASSNITLKNASSTSFHIEILDLYGNIIYKEIVEGNNSKNIYIKDLQAGTYIIRTINGLEFNIYKFIKR